MFADVVHDYLRRIQYGADGYASLIHLPAYGHAEVVADPTRSFGAPTGAIAASRHPAGQAAVLTPTCRARPDAVSPPSLLVGVVQGQVGEGTSTLPQKDRWSGLPPPKVRRRPGTGATPRG